MTSTLTWAIRGSDRSAVARLPASGKNILLSGASKLCHCASAVQSRGENQCLPGHFDYGRKPEAAGLGHERRDEHVAVREAHLRPYREKARAATTAS